MIHAGLAYGRDGFGSMNIGVTAMLLGAMGMASVGKAVFIDKLGLNCACVVGNARMPLGVLSFSENLLMELMGTAMLVAG